MDISYFRSSSLNNWSYCQQQYFISYVLGIPAVANQKTDMGTITHKVLEILAMIKHATQRNEDYIEDDIMGKMKFGKDWMKPTFLTEEEIAIENKSRSAKSIYKYNCLLPKNHVRYGVDLVNLIIDKVYSYYIAKLPHHDWTGATAKQVKIMSWIALDFKNGMFDPRKRDILSPEKQFDFPIDEPWANNLRLKGTVDLITKIDDDTIEIIDWKTGQRMDWAAKDTPVKDFNRLCKDTQLMLYYYAVREMYPEYPHVILSIFFIRDGGPFSICFDDETIDKIKNKIKSTAAVIKECDIPKMVSSGQTDFRCTRLCHFYKNNWPGSKKNMCQYVHDYIKQHGIEKASNDLKRADFSTSDYKAPGE